MSSRREGLILHRMLRTVEELAAGFKALGMNEEDALRAALLATYRLEGWSPEEAKKAADHGNEVVRRMAAMRPPCPQEPE